MNLGDGSLFGTADDADYAAGVAYRDKDFMRAGRLIQLARTMDPAREPQWIERLSRVERGARDAGAVACASDSRQPLAEILDTRMKAAGLSPGDPDVRFIAEWNAPLLAAQRGDSEPESQRPAPEPEPELEAGQ